jgi:predicted CopG family antitoxin
MKNLIRTSITIPEDVYASARVLAAQQGESVSKFITRILTKRIYQRQNASAKSDPLQILGKYSFGKKKPYQKRSDIYDENIKHKLE